MCLTENVFPDGLKPKRHKVPRIQSLPVLTPGFRRPSLVHGKVDWFFRTKAIINMQILFAFETINSQYISELPCVFTVI